MGLPPLQGPLREAPYGGGTVLTGRVPYGKGPLREGWLPSQKRTTKRLTGRHGKLFTGRDGPYEKESKTQNPTDEPTQFFKT